MYRLLTCGLALSMIVLFGCNSEASISSDQEFTRPDIINWKYVDNLPAEPAGNRAVKVYQSDVAIAAVGNEEIVVLTGPAENPSAYVLQQENRGAQPDQELENAWIVYLNDHLIIISEDGKRKMRYSLNGKRINSQVLNDGISYDVVHEGFGLSRYHDRQPVTIEDLKAANSYLEARARVGK